MVHALLMTGKAASVRAVKAEFEIRRGAEYGHMPDF
jgi:hypothetical protein